MCLCTKTSHAAGSSRAHISKILRTWNCDEVSATTSVIVQQDVTIYSFIIFLKTALQVSDDTIIRHQEHAQTVITTSATDWTLFATICWRGGVGRNSVLTPPHQRTVANTVQPLPDVITVWVCSWCWVRLSSEACRAVCRNIIKLYIVASCWTIIDIDSRCTGPWT